MYIVVNLPTLEERSDINGTMIVYYNTNIALDRSGRLVAKYRKYHLYGEILMSKIDSPDISYFETDFGIKIGMFICFDINYESPANNLTNLGIDTIAYSVAWFDELPFLTGIL